MNFETLKKVVLSGTKGAFRSIVWEREMKTKKAYADYNIVKRSTAVVRFGVEYDNIKAVQEKRSTGELPAQNAGLQWGEWLLYPYFIKHKGNIYLRCATSKVKRWRHNAYFICYTGRIKSEYFLNGRKIDKAIIENMCLASEFRQTEKLDVFTINCENIIAIR